VLVEKEPTIFLDEEWVNDSSLGVVDLDDGLISDLFYPNGSLFFLINRSFSILNLLLTSSKDYVSRFDSISSIN